MRRIYQEKNYPSRDVGYSGKEAIDNQWSLGLSPEGWPGEGHREGRRPKEGGRLKETITLLKGLWNETEVSFKGSHFNLEKASVDIRPDQVGGISILVGGTTSASMNLAATLADGWVHRSPEGVERGCQIVRQPPSRAGRNLTLWNWEPMAPYLGSVYRGHYDVDRWCAFGPPTECAAFIKRFLDIGFTPVMLSMADTEGLHVLQGPR